MTYSRSTDKQIVVNLYDGLLFSNKRNELLTHIITWINPQNNYADWNKPDKKGCIVYGPNLYKTLETAI